MTAAETAALRNILRSSCEAWAVVLASKLTPLPLASLIAGETRREAWALFRGQAERKRPKETGAKDYKFRLAKRLARRLREHLSLRAPRRVFQASTRYTGSKQPGSKQPGLQQLSSAARFAPHIPRVIAALGCA